MRDFGIREVGLLRIIFFLSLYLVIPIDRMSAFSSNPDWLQCSNVNSMWFSFSLSPFVSSILAILLKITLVTAAVGLFTNLSYWIALISLSILLGYWNQFCYITHELTPIPISIFLWALLDQSSGYRLSNVFSGSSSSITEKTTSLLIPAQRSFFCLIFLSAGLSKVLTSGLSWIQDPSLKNILTLQNFLFEGSWLLPSFPSLNNWITGHPFLCSILAAFALGMELMTPIALFSRRAAMVIVPGLAVLQIGILTLVYINFVTWIPIYLFWIPSSLLTWLVMRIQTQKKKKQNIQMESLNE